MRAGQIDCGSKEHLVARKLPAQQLDLALAFAAGQVGEARVNLLQAEHVGVRQASGFAHDAGGVDDAVDAPAPLDVPGEKPQLLQVLEIQRDHLELQ